MSAAYISCPRCRRSLKVPPLRDLVKLHLALQAVPGAAGVELRCRACQATFPLQEALEKGKP